MLIGTSYCERFFESILSGRALTFFQTHNQPCIICSLESKAIDFALMNFLFLFSEAVRSLTIEKVVRLLYLWSACRVSRGRRKTHVLFALAGCSKRDTRTNTLLCDGWYERTWGWGLPSFWGCFHGGLHSRNIYLSRLVAEVDSLEWAIATWVESTETSHRTSITEGLRFGRNFISIYMYTSIYILQSAEPNFEIVRKVIV